MCILSFAQRVDIQSCSLKLKVENWWFLRLEFWVQAWSLCSRLRSTESGNREAKKRAEGWMQRLGLRWEHPSFRPISWTIRLITNWYLTPAKKENILGCISAQWSLHSNTNIQCPKSSCRWRAHWKSYWLLATKLFLLQTFLVSLWQWNYCFFCDKQWWSLTHFQWWSLTHFQWHASFRLRHFVILFRFFFFLLA